MIYRALNLGGMNLKVSPFLQKAGDLLRCVNIDSTFYGAKRKRPGYITFLGTANGSAPTDLFSWQKDDGTTTFLYRNSGGLLYYSTQGTGAWTACGNGTIAAGNHIGHAVLENTLIVGQAGGTTRHTTNGTSFTNTTAAPAEQFFASKFNRIWSGGTASNLFYSTSGTPSDWSSDSSSIKVPGPGKINGIFTANDRIVITKNSGLMFTYDDYNLRQVPTDQGPTSPYSLAETEDYWFYLNRQGYFGYNGNRPELLSNPIENQIYNNAGSAIAGATFDSAPGVTHRLNYYSAVGTTTDEITEETVGNCIQRYDYQLDQWDNYKFANFPTAWHSFKDASGVQQLIFGASGGQCYKLSGTALADNTSSIEATMEGVLHFDAPEKDKKFNYLWAFASPGCNAKVAVAIADNFSKQKKNWVDIGDLTTGCREFRFPSNSRGKLLFWRLYEYSKDPPFTFYGFCFDLEGIGK